MDAWLERYLDLAALDAVGAALLDPRPAFVASGDGGTIPWANAAGIRLFRAGHAAELAERALGDRNPLRAALSRLSRLLPSDRSRLEALPLPLTSWPAHCRRLNLPDGTRAILAVGAAEISREGLRTRADRLVTSLAGGERRLAVVDRDGLIVAASASLDPSVMASLGGARPLGDRGGSRRARQTFSSGGVEAVAEGLAFEADGEALVLLVLGAERAFAPAPAGFMRARQAPVEEAARPLAPKAVATESSPPAATSSPIAEAVAPAPAAAMTTAAHSPPQTEESPPEAPELSGNEADAFRRIREALARTGARFPDAARVGVEAEAEGAVSADSKRPPPIAAPAFDETLLDRLSVGLAIFRERRILLANRTLLDLLGFDSVAAFAAAGGVEAIFIDGTRLWAGADFDDRDGRLAVRTRGGAIVPVEARLNTVTFAGETAFMLSVAPRPVPVEAAVVDATAAERRIHDLETILNTATDGVLTLDRHGAIMSMNRAAEALFAVEAGDFKGRPFTELLAEESHRTALDYLDGLAANGVASVLNDGREVIGRVPHGGLIPLYMSMGRLGDSGRFSAVLRDITHWKTIEEELTAARREAEAANAQKSEFLAKISHEIRTPLNAIIGFSEIMMEQRFGPVENDRYRAYLKDIHVSGQHLISLINDLLDLSKIEAGKVELTFEAVAVNAVIQEGVALMQPLANRERIIIRTSLSTDLPNVVADQRSFRQILLNLLSNAIKFTRAGGQVIVSTLLEESGEVVVRIRDTGIGMSAAEIETAMKPFEQVAIARGDRDKGTGLGLPLTKAMVEANRAAFAIESAPNQGTLVRVTFPTTRVLAG